MQFFNLNSKVMHARFRYLGLDIIVFRIYTSSSLYEKIENRIRGNTSQYAPVHLVFKVFNFIGYFISCVSTAHWPNESYLEM